MENVQDLKYTQQRKVKTLLSTILNHLLVVLFAAFILIPLYMNMYSSNIKKGVILWID